MKNESQGKWGEDLRGWWDYQKIERQHWDSSYILVSGLERAWRKALNSPAAPTRARIRRALMVAEGSEYGEKDCLYSSLERGRHNSRGVIVLHKHNCTFLFPRVLHQLWCPVPLTLGDLQVTGKCFFPRPESESKQGKSSPPPPPPPIYTVGFLRLRRWVLGRKCLGPIEILWLCGC